MNVAFSGTACLTGLGTAKIMASDRGWPVACTSTKDAVAVERVAGITRDMGDRIEDVRRLGGRIAAGRRYVLLAHLARWHSEIEVINGSIRR